MNTCIALNFKVLWPYEDLSRETMFMDVNSEFLIYVAASRPWLFFKHRNFGNRISFVVQKIRYIYIGSFSFQSPLTQKINFLPKSFFCYKVGQVE